jgi:hypothetical protein
MMAKLSTTYRVEDPETGVELIINHVWSERKVSLKLVDHAVDDTSIEISIGIEDWRALSKS